MSKQLQIDFAAVVLEDCAHCGKPFPPEELNRWDKACERCEENLSIQAEFNYQRGCRLDGMTSADHAADQQFHSDRAHAAR